MAKVSFGNIIEENCSAIIIDGPTVLADYSLIWEREVAFIAQDLAGKHSAVQGQFFRNRATFIKLLGFNPGSGFRDTFSPLFLLPCEQIISIITAVLYINEIDWETATKSIQETLQSLQDDAEITSLLRITTGSLGKVKELKKSNIKIVCLCSSVFIDDEKIISQSDLDSFIDLYVKDDWKEGMNPVKNVADKLQLAPREITTITARPFTIQKLQESGYKFTSLTSYNNSSEENHIQSLEAIKI